MIDKALAITFHPAKYLAFGLYTWITTPAIKNPIAVKTKLTDPVIIFAVDDENKYCTSMYFAWYLK